MKTVSIIVLNWNNPKLSVETVESILKIEHHSFLYTIYLIDNGSTDNSFSVFKQKYSTNSHIKIIRLEDNLGFVEGNNAGIKESLENGFDYTLIINNDVIVKPNFLQVLFDYLDQNQDVSLVGPKIYFAPGHEYHQKRYGKSELGRVIWSYGGTFDYNNVLGSNTGIDEVDRGQFNHDLKNPSFISGCCILVNNIVFKKIGLFDPKYFMYLEDVDLCYRAKKSGYQLAIVANSHIWHINSGSSSIGGDLHDYFLTRNRLIFAFKHLSIRTKIAIARQSLQIFLNSKSKWQKKAITDFYRSKLGRGSWGEK